MYVTEAKNLETALTYVTDQPRVMQPIALWIP